MIRIRFHFLAMLMLGLVVSGCQPQQRPVRPAPVVVPLCVPPTGIGLEKAIARTRTDLASYECQKKLDAYFQRLLEIAEGDPNLENKRLFSEFLLWCNSEGILTKVQSRNYYNRYFNDTFMSLPDEYNVCSSCPKRADIVRDMEVELRQKEQGLMRACGDRNAYYSAQEQYDTILIVLEATCLACERGR